MNVETAPFTVGTRYGDLLVAVIAAKRDRFNDFERGNVMEIRPRVRVATDPAFEANPASAAHWVIRRRAYAVHETLYFHDLSSVMYCNGLTGDRWHLEDRPYRGGFRNDRGAPVEYPSVTHELMREAVTAAVEEFASVHPQWGEFSRYLLLHGEAEAARFSAVEARREADAYEDKATALYCQATGVASHLPADLLARMPEGA